MENAILITFLVATSMVYQTLAQEEEISPSPEQFVDQPAEVYDHELLSHLTTRRIKFLQDCSDKLNSKCGVEMTEGLVNNSPVSNKCCKGILKIGKDCHEGLMKLVFSNYELRDIAREILPRSKRIWNQCVKTTGASLAFET